MATELTCPKCHGPMRSYERNGIQIDQCTECRGVYLDRGELELLMDAEAAYSRSAQPAAAAPIPRPSQASQMSGYNWGHGGHHGKRRKGFLAELFD